MIGGWVIIAGLLATFGLPLLAVGVVLRLCERSWQRPRGSMGSLWLLGVGGLLCLPLAVYVVPAVLDRLSR